MLLQWTQKFSVLPRLTQLNGIIMQKRRLCVPKVDDPAQLRDVLRQYSIPVEQYGQENAKSIEKLWEEIQQGETILQEDAGRLVRSLHVVVCRIQDENGRTLYEVAQRFSDGRRRVRNQPLSEKMKPGEDPFEAAKRVRMHFFCQIETGGHNTAYINRLYSINSCVQGILEELGDLVTESTIIALQSDPTTPVEYSTLVSNSYPGLLSKYTVYRVDASVEGLPSSSFTTTEVAGDVGYEHEWEWVHASAQ